VKHKNLQKGEIRTMFILHVDCVLRPNSRGSILRTYRDRFVPAISVQPGYVDTMLLRAVEEGGADYRLVIAFESHEKQQAWVATDVHQRVWPEMEGNMREFTVRAFETE
jgi:heme-degrading monooxygenase HmoA